MAALLAARAEPILTLAASSAAAAAAARPRRKHRLPVARTVCKRPAADIIIAFSGEGRDQRLQRLLGEALAGRRELFGVLAQLVERVERRERRLLMRHTVADPAELRPRQFGRRDRVGEGVLGAVRGR